MERAVACACLAFSSAIFLHGCDFGAPEREVKKIETEIERDLPKPPAFKKASAKCNGGHFHCDGGWREWCNNMKKRCTKKDCAPMCAWSCDSPQCNQQCGPVCNQPICSTRCKGFNTDSCKMKCGQPNCKVVCPKHFCPSQDCAACKTECGKPSCKMICGVDEQPCRHVCAQPVCKWECKNPNACPKPKCAMKCKKAPDCMQKNHMFSKVPPLEPGETEIVTATDGPAPSPAAASFLTNKVSSMRVNFTRMGDDHTLQTGQVDLALMQVDEMDEATIWTRAVSERFGHVMESEAYCTNGKFRCQGDEAWCAEQEKIVCADYAHSETTFVHRKSGVQSHLQA